MSLSSKNSDLQNNIRLLEPYSVKCIPYSWKCDGQFDCKYKDDEYNCPSKILNFLKILYRCEMFGRSN